MHKMLFAGFGGQGILFVGKVMAYCGLVDGKNVSWLPSYGPEMRGGTANCHVIVSEAPVGSPIVVKPTSLIVMNRPSLDKFEDSVISDGMIFVDSSLIDRKVKRDDVNVFYINATKIADEMNAPKLANMVMMGKVLKETKVVDLEVAKAALAKSIPPTKKDLFDKNWAAIEAGFNL